MRLARPLAYLSALALAALGACSSSSDAPGSTAAGTTTTTTTTSSGSGGHGSGGGGTGSAGGGGAGQGGAAPDGGSCASIAGTYTGQGTCSDPSRYFPSAVCARQDGCKVEVFTNGNQDYSGSVTGEDFSVSLSKPIPITCTGKAQQDKPTTMSCGAMGITCNGTVTPDALKDATNPCCDVVKQDCGAGLRCQVVGSASGGAFTACIKDDGQVANGGTCKRASEGPLDVGHDDCQKGSFCTRLMSPDPAVRHCQPLCALDADCGAGKACFDAGAAPVVGICLGTCTMFAAGGDAGACPAGTTCRMATSLGAAGRLVNVLCDAAGAKKDGDACQAFVECGAGLACISGTCRAYCDAAHPCATGSCAAFTGAKAEGIDATLGLCQ
jgi:hypothetical protein